MAAPAGSFFKNPIVSAAKFSDVEAIAISRDVKLASFPASPGHVKIPAAWLVSNQDSLRVIRVAR